jgi:long-chain acyl-CoA synthetase
MTKFATLAGLSEHFAGTTPDRTALVFGADRVSFADFHDRVLRTVAALRGVGIGAGDRIGWLALNHPDYVVLMQACLRIGAVLVAINARLVAREIAFIVGDAGIKLLVTEAQFLDLVIEARAGSGIETIVLVDSGLGKFPAFGDWVARHAPDAAQHDVQPEDVAIQLYTSGTTGFPKGALITHRNLIGVIEKGALTGEDWSGWDENDVALVAMPLFHIGGTGWALHAMEAGATMVILPRPDIADIIAAVEEERITKMFAVPAVLNMILDHPRGAGADLTSLSELLYGASPIPLDVLRRSMVKFPNASFIQCYGATETTGTVVYLPPSDHHPDGTPRMLGCGKPFPGNEIRIVGENGAILPPLGVGEIAIRSVSVMAGYHNRPEATAAAVVDGWYLSGDAGYLDEDGYLYIFDRVKDMIVSGAENIYPAEVENALHEHPGVKDCAVIGVPDPRWGEAVKAIVVRAAGSTVGPAELIAFARERVAGFKVPKSVDFIDELPRNASGKILKKDLRKPFWPEGERQVG